MNNIRTIGVAGGIFHILVPGVFLLVNIIAAVCFFPFEGYVAQQNNILRVFSDPIIGLVLIISLGYFFGVLLRFFRCEATDRLAGWLLHKYYKLKKMIFLKKKPESSNETISCKYSEYVEGDYFPYIQWLEKVIVGKELPPDVKDFFDQVWKEKGNSKTFINFCKLLVISHDERAASEIYADEAICRYISGTLYALFMASGLLFIVFIARWITNGFNILILGLLIGYLIAIVSILLNFRFMRLKEVQTVFFATYKNRGLFPQDAHDTPSVSKQS